MGELDNINAKYKDLNYEERIKELYNDFDMKDVLLTSSFGITSILLIHIFNRIKKEQPIHFIDTHYLFEETIQYKKDLIEKFGLTVVDIYPEDWKHDFTTKEETWKRDVDFCCSINKVEPLDKAKENHKLWVSGLMSWQSRFRSRLKVFEEKNGIIKFHPLIDLTQKESDKYIKEHDLPFHPLKAEGYSSVGCTHCTQKGEGRQGRWTDSRKTECGIHL
ncbi:MAG: phosphoadenylyl-sulfate reductase [Flavobacteriales bacterium]|nr:phosphoadenylyl-sulfate reductase [Flavobacteriales bacterium]